MTQTIDDIFTTLPNYFGEPTPSSQHGYLDAVDPGVLGTADSGTQLLNLGRDARIITVASGDDIQAAINKLHILGGGRVSLRAGSYLPGSNITLFSNIAIEGEGIGNTIIDFNGGAYQISIVGSDGYSTGTVAISNDGTTVTGSGTTWTSAMVGRSILLEDFWYVISAVTDATHLTIDRNYMGANLSGSAYTIATTINTVTLKNFLVTNSSIALIKYRYANGLSLDGVLPVGGAVGLDGDDSSFINIFNGGADDCDTAMTFDNVYFGTFFNNNITECGAGFIANSIRNWCIDVFAFVNIGGNAMSFTNSSNNSILDFSIQNITGRGIEFISGNSDIGVTDGVVKNCTSDGIKLTATSDYLNIGGLQIHDNGGYGVNIAAASCDNNVVAQCPMYSNSSGNLNDLGTGTVISANPGV